MGLLNKLNEYANLEKSSAYSQTVKKDNNISDQLLKKSIVPNTDESYFFWAFLKAYHLNNCAILNKFDNQFLIQFSYGFDGKSITNSLSTLDFWNGIIQENKWYFYNTTDLGFAPFKQLFSEEMLEKMQNVSFYKTSFDKIIILYNYNLPEKSDLLDNFCKINFNSEMDSTNHNHKYNIDLDDAITSYLYANSIKNFESQIKNSFINAVYIALHFYFDSNYSISIKDGIVIQISCENEISIPLELLNKHLITNLSQIFKDSATLITLYKL